MMPATRAIVLTFVAVSSESEDDARRLAPRPLQKQRALALVPGQRRRALELQARLI